MSLDLSSIEDKQRIVITGNHGINIIFDIAAHVLSYHQRSFDSLRNDGSQNLTDAPLIIIEGIDEKDPKTSEASFLGIPHHIAIIHQVSDDHFPEKYQDFDEYVHQYERLADLTPKGGSILYNQEDNIANVIAGEKEREDVKLLEYKALKKEEYPFLAGELIQGGAAKHC